MSKNVCLNFRLFPLEEADSSVYEKTNPVVYPNSVDPLPSFNPNGLHQGVFNLRPVDPFEQARQRNWPFDMILFWFLTEKYIIKLKN